MDSGVPTNHRSAGARIGWSRRRALSASLLLPIAFVAAIYALLLPRALDTPLIGVGAVGVVAIIGLVTAVGAERSSTAMLVLAFFFAPLTSFAIGPKPLVLASVFFAAAFALALPRLVHQPLRLPANFVVGAVLFTVMGFIAALVAISATVSLVYLVTAVVALVLMPAAVVWMGPTNRQMFAMALAFGIGTSVSTLIGLPRNEFRNSGFTYHPVALAYTATLTLSFVPFLLASKVRGRWIVVPPMALIALVGVWTSGSRTGIVVLVVLALLVPMLERSIKLGLVVASGIVVVLPTVLSYDPTRGSTTALSRLFGTGGAQGSDAIRRNTLQDGWEQIRSSPIFGNGYSVEHTYVIHNIYVQVLAAEGVIGLIGLLMMLAVLILPLRSAPAPQRCLAYPVVAVIVSGPFQPNMSDHYLGMTLGLALVAAVGVMNKKRGLDDAPDAEAGLVPDPAQARV